MAGEEGGEGILYVCFLSQGQTGLGGILSAMETTMDSSNSVVVKNPKILSGTPVFRGTRVPVQLFFDSLERGHTLEDFLEGYPTVSREMADVAVKKAQSKCDGEW